MPESIISNSLSREQLDAMRSAVVALESLDHYLKHGSVHDRKMANLAHVHRTMLQGIIDQDNARKQMGTILSYPNDI
jgi:hypothetical protein